MADEIADRARQEGLVLFLGAGVNGTAGLGWGALLDQLLSRALKSAVVPSAQENPGLTEDALGERYDCYAKASIAAMLLGPRLFVPRLRSILYSRLQDGCALPQLQELCRLAGEHPTTRIAELAPDAITAAFGFLATLARLCMRLEIVAVVTYNYDTLLELAMGHVRQVGSGPDRWNARTAVPIARQTPRSRSTYPMLNVYHVHGCLPPPGSIARVVDCPVVLTQRDYARMMQNPYAWEESSQLHFLRSFPCLFLGLSMSDWNMLRLLQSARPAADSARRLYCVGASTTRLNTEIRQKLLAGHGVAFHSAGPGTEGHAEVREFADDLFFNLHKTQ